MNFEALRMFLSEENIRRHEEYLKTLKLKLSILEKSDERIKGRGIDCLRRMALDRYLKAEAISLIKKIRSHECFFDSFETNTGRAAGAEKLLYDVYAFANNEETGFIYIYKDSRGVKLTKEFVDKPEMLCLDLYEHCYFLDYGFQREKFLRNAIGYLDVARVLDNNEKKGYN